MKTIEEVLKEMPDNTWVCLTKVQKRHIFNCFGKFAAQQVKDKDAEIEELKSELESMTKQKDDLYNELYELNQTTKTDKI